MKQNNSVEGDDVQDLDGESLGGKKERRRKKDKEIFNR
jgi:hypothetical protein